jgi:hypothetical protein
LSIVHRRRIFPPTDRLQGGSVENSFGHRVYDYRIDDAAKPTYIE